MTAPLSRRASSVLLLVGIVLLALFATIWMAASTRAQEAHTAGRHARGDLAIQPGVRRELHLAAARSSGARQVAPTRHTPAVCQGGLGAAQLHPRGRLPHFLSLGYDDPLSPYQAIRYLAQEIVAGRFERLGCASNESVSTRQARRARRRADVRRARCPYRGVRTQARRSRCAPWSRRDLASCRGRRHRRARRPVLVEARRLLRRSAAAAVRRRRLWWVLSVRTRRGGIDRMAHGGRAVSAVGGASATRRGHAARASGHWRKRMTQMATRDEASIIRTGVSRRRPGRSSRPRSASSTLPARLRQRRPEQIHQAIRVPATEQSTDPVVRRRMPRSSFATFTACRSPI